MSSIDDFYAVPLPGGVAGKLYLPSSLSDKEVHPLVIWLDDEVETFLSLPAVHQAAPVVAAPAPQRWSDLPGEVAPRANPALQSLFDAIDLLECDYPVDFSRVSIFGSGVNAAAAWEFLIRRCGRLAGAVIVGGHTDCSQIPPRQHTRLHLCSVPGCDLSSELETVRRILWQAEHEISPEPLAETAVRLHADNALAGWLFSCRDRVFSTIEKVDRSTVTLSGFGFTARISPAAGGNLFSLHHQGTGQKLLREPHRIEELFFTPERFGIPVLFPPNRIDGGKFTFHGKAYQLPVTETVFNNHLHGLATGKKWEVVEIAPLSATLKFHFDRNDERFSGFPFEFELIHEFTLTPTGLRDTMTVRNLGHEIMPLGLGYHTAFPSENVRCRVGCTGELVEIGDRILPTGRTLPWGKGENPSESFEPEHRVVGFHAPTGLLAGSDGRSFRGAELVYPTGVLRYRLDEKFRYWYTWNAGGQQKFVCFEPVSWISNALNQTQLVPEVSGVRELAPGKSESFTNELEFTVNGHLSK